MQVHVNGKPVALEDRATVMQLIEVMELGSRRVAVEVNKELVVKKEWEQTVLKDGDRVEVVSFVGGG